MQVIRFEKPVPIDVVGNTPHDVIDVNGMDLGPLETATPAPPALPVCTCDADRHHGHHIRACPAWRRFDHCGLRFDEAELLPARREGVARICLVSRRRDLDEQRACLEVAALTCDAVYAPCAKAVLLPADQVADAEPPSHMDEEEHRSWGERVSEQLRLRHGDGPLELVCFCGTFDARAIPRPSPAWRFLHPFDPLGFFEELGWLKRQREAVNAAKAAVNAEPAPVNETAPAVNTEPVPVNDTVCAGMKDGLCSDGRTPCHGPAACDAEQLARGADPSDLGHTVPTEDEVREAQLAAGLPWPVPPPVTSRPLGGVGVRPATTPRPDGMTPAGPAPSPVPPTRACGSCGSTTGAVLYERGPLAGKRRCWNCAKPILEGSNA